MIVAGANINQVTVRGATPLNIAAQNDHQDIVSTLITLNGVTPRYIAAQNGHQNIVSTLIAAGANINLGNNNGVTPLLVAAQNGDQDIASILITAGANLNGMTSRHIAAQERAPRYCINADYSWSKYRSRQQRNLTLKLV
ncbi:hypothetical protein THRCLA_22347 [Thraustotheca clavata]|uniref:Uncharacterized protein n=1 Tax=Thraustotheca clavata TaxID=74557 RepID=A0A1V9Z524_9STRA|nr:hypothetical protein THRCLA_22347 [Thraustotheca clavata]